MANEIPLRVADARTRSGGRLHIQWLQVVHIEIQIAWIVALAEPATFQSSFQSKTSSNIQRDTTAALGATRPFYFSISLFLMEMSCLEPMEVDGLPGTSCLAVNFVQSLEIFDSIGHGCHFAAVSSLGRCLHHHRRDQHRQHQHDQHDHRH